jgi:hypothetical protein
MPPDISNFARLKPAYRPMRADSGKNATDIQKLQTLLQKSANQTTNSLKNESSLTSDCSFVDEKGFARKPTSFEGSAYCCQTSQFDLSMHRKLADSNNGMILDSPNNSDC